MQIRIAVFAVLAAMISPARADADAQAASVGECDGLPRLAVPTAPGFCLGLVANGFSAPRSLQVLPDGGIVVADMGNWQGGRGRIWLLRKQERGYSKELLFDRLDRPSSVAVAPDGSIFVGMVGRIARFDPRLKQPVLKDVIGGTSGVAALPGHGRHLLPSLLFDAKGNLFVNVGSGSDHCEDDGGQMSPGSRCAEREGAEALGVIRKYALQWPAGTVRGWEVYARGLRNSMALAFDRSASFGRAKTAGTPSTRPCQA